MRSGTREATFAVGTLAEVPLARALLYVRAKRYTGVLDLRAASRRQGWIVFFRGSVVSVSVTPTVARFGAVAYELGLIDGETLDASMLDSTHDRRPHAEHLVERGVLTEAEHRAVLEEQACRRVHHMFTYPDTTRFTFRESRPSGAATNGLLDVLMPVRRALVDFPPTGGLRDVLAIVGSRRLRLEPGASLDRAGFDAEEAALCRALAARAHTIDELRAASRLPPARVDLLIYLLLLARAATPEGAVTAAVPSREMWAATRQGEPPRTASTTLAKVSGPKELGLDGVRARALHVAEESPFETLGLEDGASPEAVRAAYFRLSKRWHPDRLPPELEPVRTAVELVFARMTEAHALLTRTIDEAKSR
jgi:hypothetical protein